MVPKSATIYTLSLDFQYRDARAQMLKIGYIEIAKCTQIKISENLTCIKFSLHWITNLVTFKKKYLILGLPISYLGNNLELFSSGVKML